MYVERINGTQDVCVHLRLSEAQTFTQSSPGWNNLVDSMQYQIREALNSIGPIDDMHRTIVGVYCKHGKRIQAIKHLREITRCGLKEAKDYIDDNFPRPTDPYKDGNIPF